MRILVSWSSGKDSAWALHMLRRDHANNIGALLTTTNEAAGRVAMHAVRNELLAAQAAAVGLPVWNVPLPWPCSNEEYEQRLGAAVGRAVAEGFTHVAFGDLFLEDVRRYREDRLAGSGLSPIFPLWREPTADLAHTMIDSGLKARLTCVDPRVIPAELAGREFDRALLRDLPESADPCGERGEFHSFAYGGPMFDRDLSIVQGETVTRDGFVFTDLMLETLVG